MNLGMLLERNARYLGGKTALVFEEQRLTFAELDRRVNRAANALHAAGLRKGDKLAAFLPNSLELYVLYWVAAKTGAVAVPLSTHRSCPTRRAPPWSPHPSWPRRSRPSARSSRSRRSGAS
jgi:acyl-CoA synthetase (AMP-forming)/AMP-acid ligase II